jgi:hypothetical protein
VIGSARQGGAVAAEGEHGQDDECLWGAESERYAGEQPDLGVGGFDQSLGEAVVEGGVDGFAVSHDASGQLNEYRDEAAPGPGDPPVQGLFAVLALDRKHMAQALFEQIGAIQPGIGLGDPDCSEALRVTTWVQRSGAGAEQLVLVGRAGSCLWCRGGTVIRSLVGDGPPVVSLAGVRGRGRLFAVGGAVVTVEADLDGVERRLVAGELWCPSSGGVLAGWGWARSRQMRGPDGPVQLCPRLVAVHRLWGDACCR